MAIDQTSAAMIGAAIGATGAIAGQIVAALFTARRESRKLEWDQRVHFADRRLELFAQILSDVEDLVTEMVPDLRGPRGGKGWLQPLRAADGAERIYQAWHSAFARQLAEVRLLAPTIASSFSRLDVALASLAGWGANHPQMDLREHAGEVVEGIEDCRKEMRKVIGVESGGEWVKRPRRRPWRTTRDPYK